MMDPRLKYKARVVWTYDHYIPGLSYHRKKRKVGVYLGVCSHSFRWWRRRKSVQMAWVLFDGNRRASRVPLGSLRLASEVGLG